MLFSVTFTTRGVPGGERYVLGSGVRCRVGELLFSTCECRVIINISLNEMNVDILRIRFCGQFILSLSMNETYEESICGYVLERNFGILIQQTDINKECLCHKASLMV